MSQYGSTGELYDRSINGKTHEKVSKFKHEGITLIKQNYVQTGSKVRYNLGTC
jgi:hypothetical protein